MIRLPIDRKQLFATIAAAYFRRIHAFKLSNGDSSKKHNLWHRAVRKERNS